MIRKHIIKLIKHPQHLFLSLGHRGFFNWMKDETYLKIAYWCKMNKKLNITKPKTFNEKLQWLKLNDRNPLYSNLVDKYEVRKYITEKIGEEYLIPLLGVWDDVDDIDFSKLPNQFVLKCTHDSGGLVICKDKNRLDINKTKKKLNKSMKHNYYWGQREWPYKNVKPRIIAEKYIVDKSRNELRDYKFFCFDGEVKLMYVATDRGISTKFDFFDLDFNHMTFMQRYPNSNKIIEKPGKFDEMAMISRELSENIPHVRVDLYEVNGKIYFGEMTFYHFSGMERFEPSEYDSLLGSWLELSIEKNKK